MKSVLSLYQGIGKGVRASMNSHAPFLFDGPKPPTWQTPGRLQYYRAENAIFLPTEIKWRIQMPKHIAGRAESFMYNDKVQDEILQFMGQTIRHDYIQGNRDVNLDLTVAEASKLFNAGDKIKAMAESGKLSELHKRCTSQVQAVESGYIKVMDQLDRTLQQVCEAEHDIYDELLDSEIEGMNKLNTGEQGETIFNNLSFVDSTSPLENYEIVRRVAEQKGDSDIVLAEKNLKSLLATRAHIMAAKATVQESILANIPDNELGAIQQELDEFKNTAKQYGIHAEEEDVEGGSQKDDVNFQQLQNILTGDMKTLLSDIDACNKSQAERNELYVDFDTSEDAQDQFRQNLLKHLAGRIVIKEHKIRYQKEQFDRFVASLKTYELKDHGQTLREFSQNYSNMMNSLTLSSHNYRCHKIEANYDDFGEQTIKPLNATIFFYFFSANRSGKTWAQWMLSSARYPNDRMRRAYMRFFA